jgi:ribose transport system substrate-binding protein
MSSRKDSYSSPYTLDEAQIPLIAVEIPHPNAVFLGVDNQRAGAVAGRALHKAAQTHWNGECDEMLFLDLEIAGSLPHLRLSSAQNILRNAFTWLWIS